MTLAQLASFVEIARCLSFRRAAERLHLAQPSVSAHVRELERELGARLFERLGRRVRLTEAGAALLQHAERILLDVREAREAVDALAGVARGSLALGTTASLVGTILPPVVRRLQLDAPEVSVSLSVTTSEQVIADVRRGDLDLGIAYLTHPEPTIQALPLLDDDFILVAATGHPLSHESSVPVAALDGMALIGLAPETAGRVVTDRELTRAGVRPHFLMEMSSSDAIKGMVAAGVAPAIVSRLAVERELRMGLLREVPVDGLSIHHPVVVVIRHGPPRIVVGAALRALNAVYPTPQG